MNYICCAGEIFKETDILRPSPSYLISACNHLRKGGEGGEFSQTKRKKMTLVRTRKKNNPFVQIDKTLLSDERLSWKAKGILCYLLSKPDNWQVKIADIIKKSKEGRDAVRGAMGELKKHGYAKLIEVKDNKGKFKEYQYEVYESPADGLSADGKPADGLSAYGKPDTTNNNSTNNDYSNNEVTNNTLSSNKLITKEKGHTVIETEGEQTSLEINTDNPSSGNNQEQKEKKEIPLPFSGPDFAEEWEAWKKYRKEVVEKPMTKRAQKMILTSIKHNSGGDLNYAIFAMKYSRTTKTWEKPGFYEEVRLAYKDYLKKTNPAYSGHYMAPGTPRDKYDPNEDFKASTESTQ